MDGYLATLGKKERHEIRRKVRRAEAVGEIRLDRSPDPLADLDDFIDLHQKRWGERGLFPPTTGGDQSRRVLPSAVRAVRGPAGRSTSRSCRSASRRIAAGIHFETADGILYYNAGVDPDARDLSPGVVMVYAYIEQALARRLPAGRLPARRRVVQVRVGRRRRADPATARPAPGLT